MKKLDGGRGNGTRTSMLEKMQACGVQDVASVHLRTQTARDERRRMRRIGLRSNMIVCRTQIP